MNPIPVEDWNPEDDMKPERSELIEDTNPWTVKPPYITQTFNFDGFFEAYRFSDFVLTAAQGWEVLAEISLQDKAVTVDVSPLKGNALTEVDFDFVRAIHEVYRFYRPKPAEESNPAKES